MKQQILKSVVLRVLEIIAIGAPIAIISLTINLLQNSNLGKGGAQGTGMVPPGRALVSFYRPNIQIPISPS